MDRFRFSAVLALCFFVAVFGFASAGAAQGRDAERKEKELDCEAPENEEEIACLFLPEGGATITNFVPITTPLVGAAALAGIGGSTASTTSTTSTTSP